MEQSRLNLIIHKLKFLFINCEVHIHSFIAFQVIFNGLKKQPQGEGITEPAVTFTSGVMVIHQTHRHPRSTDSTEMEHLYGTCILNNCYND
jgi:hypothetical protein